MKRVKVLDKFRHGSLIVISIFSGEFLCLHRKRDKVLNKRSMMSVEESKVRCENEL